MFSPKSASTWSAVVLGLALLFVAATAYAIAGSRFGLVSYPNAFAWLDYIGRAGAVALIGCLVVLVLAVRSRNIGARIQAGAGTVILAALVATMIAYRVGPPPQPFINDVTTDLDDPPEFRAVLPLRPEGSNPAEYGGPEVAANQRQAHPEIEPLMTPLAPGEAFDRAVDVARQMGWDIVSADASRGIIEAVDTTPFFRFHDDVVVRVRPEGSGSRVDLRSHSRIGLTDLGKNAARIVEFIANFTES